MSSEYIPLVSWETKLVDVQPVLARPFHYICKVSSVNPNDYDPNELGENGTLLVPKTDRFYIVDYTGKIYQIKYVVDVPTKTVEIYDLTEDADEGPYISESAFVYQTRNGINVLTQAQRKRLHPSAIDQIWNIENNIIRTNYNFLDLTDTPSAYTDQAGFIPKVNVGETALEFLDPSTDWLSQYALLAGRSGDVLKIDELQEFTSANGVKIDGLYIKDTGINFEVGATTRIFKDGSNNLSFTDAITGTKTLAQLVNAPMVYPGAGIPISTGSAWGTSITPATGYLRYTGAAFEWKNETYLTALPNHNLIDTTNHTVSGLTAGHFLKALTPTSYGFAAHGLTYSDVGAAPAGTVSSQWTTDANGITYAGNVGIGVASSASHLLYINGGIKAKYLYSNGVSGIYVGNTEDGLGFGTGGLICAYGDNPLYFYTNSTARLFIKGDGNVGIGTTAPSYDLELRKSTSGGGVSMRIYNTADAANTYSSLILATPFSGGTGTTIGEIKVDDQKLMTISNDYGNISLIPTGNVGIGTAAPKKKLEVAGDIMAGTNNAIGWRYSAGNDNYYSYLTANGASYLNIVGGLFTTDGTTEAIRLTSYSGTVSMLNNGNVGIGTTPSYTLDVNGSCRIGTLGGIIYGTSGVLSGIANGTTGQVLKMGATAPEWGAGGSVSFGTDNQIPVMNSEGTDFEYYNDFTYDGTRLILRDTNINSSIYIGTNSGSATTALLNIGIGEYALYNTSNQGGNIAIGYRALYGVTGGGNIAIGDSALQASTSGIANVCVGQSAGYSNTGSQNVFVGKSAGESNIGSNNVCLGYQSGYTGDGSDNVFLGANSGQYETGSNKLFIDNQGRISEANARISSLIYGEFNGTPASQLLRVNGVLDHSLVPNKPKIYSQATEPNIPNDTMAFWKDTDDSKYYLILDIGGTQKKVELT